MPLVSFGAPATRLYSPSEGRPFHVINAARFTATKNQAALIEAAALLARRGRDIALTLYGDGGERRACQALAEGLGIGQRVLFPGFVQDWATRGGDLFVLTSKHEGLCIVALEAMHAGIPVVAPRIGGLTAHADAGVIRDLESVDPQVVADAIAAAMDDSVTTATMVARAAGMVDQCFGAEAIRHDYAGINQALLAAVHGPTGSRRAGATRTRRRLRDANNAR